MPVMHGHCSPALTRTCCRAWGFMGFWPIKVPRLEFKGVASRLWDSGVSVRSIRLKFSEELLRGIAFIKPTAITIARMSSAGSPAP